jgi:2-iminoacetate synthase
MFSRILRELLPIAESVGRLPLLSPPEVRGLLEKAGRRERLSSDEIASLLGSTSSDETRTLIQEFSSRFERPHGREILLLPPLYFSSICENRCLYCNFSTVGSRLTPDEFLAEFEALLDLGYRSIELVSSQDPKLYAHGHAFDWDDQRFTVDGALHYFELARRRLSEAGEGMLTSNIPPVDAKSLSRLKKGGLDCYLSWLETLNPGQYRALHQGRSPKANQAFRVDAFEHAFEAGIEHVAGAFLKGLYDWRKEEVLLYLFDAYLKDACGRGFSVIGTPRLKGPFVSSPLVKAYQVGDEDFELNIALDRVLFDGILWFQTRETPELNRRLLTRYGGGVILTIDCSTAPGGYSGPPKSAAQFPVFRQQLFQTVRELEEEGFRVLFGWDSQTLTSFQRA